MQAIRNAGAHLQVDVKLFNNFRAIIDCIPVDKIHLHFYGMNHLYYYLVFLFLILEL